jgi:hypothetical protein
MRTTVDIPDPLYRELKGKAGTTRFPSHHPI